MQDLATVLAWARSQPDVVEVHLVGQGRWGPLALLARPRLEGLGRTALDLHDFDYGDGSDPIPADLDLPGVLQAGGLEAAAALCAPWPLLIDRAGKLTGSPWVENAYALADAEAHRVVRADRTAPAALAGWLDTGERP
jgi:hypothetical protein